MRCSLRRRRISFLLVPTLLLIVSTLIPCIFAQDTEMPIAAPSTAPTVEQTTNTTNVPEGPSINYELENILALRWRLIKPKIAYDGLRFDMVFTTSDFIHEELIVYTLYDGHQCSAGGGNVITDAEYFTTELTGDNNPVGGGLQTRQFTLSTSIVPETITKSNSYEEFGDVATIHFCVRFALYNNDISVHHSAKEINYLETTVTLIVDLTDDFKIQDPIVEARDAAEETSSDAFFVEGFICTEEGVPPQDTVPLNQGETVRVCVQPTRQALDVGFRMRRIDSFVFYQGTTTQEAIKNSNPSLNGLTQLWCDSGSELCAFETLLLAYFYAGPSLVTGTGVATLQFGSNRRLRSLQTPRGVSKNIDLSPFGLRTVYNRFVDASAGATPFSSNKFSVFLLMGAISLVLVYL